MSAPRPDASRLALLAPLIFAVHVAEEILGGFVEWFNGLVTPGITMNLFLFVNGTAFVITVVLAMVLTSTKTAAAALANIAWLSLLMLTNGFFHIAATVVHSRYSPGVVSGALLYIPFFCWFALTVRRQFPIGRLAVAATAIAGSIPMAVHGYLIIFRGSRLF